MTDLRRHASATIRNRDPILSVLRRILPMRGLVLEVASGSGEHAIHFARAFPNLAFQPTDPDQDALRSIEAWRDAEGADNLLPPISLDAAGPAWPVASADAILCINMVHISPWAATRGVMAGAGRLLAPGHPLYLYGPYRQADVETAPSNMAFDLSLQARNAQWGLRNLADVMAEAEKHGLVLDQLTPMPANNLSVVFLKA